MAQKKKRKERPLALHIKIEPKHEPGMEIEPGAYEIWCNGFGYADCVVHAKTVYAARRAVMGFLFNELSAEKRLEGDGYDEEDEK